MNYEEKYKKALETIQEILDCGSDSIKMSRLRLRLQNVFPELKEPEKIRNKIIDIIKSQKKQQCHIDGTIYDEMIVWLEKQGQKDPCKDCKHPMLNCMNFPCLKKQEYQGKTALEAIHEQKADNANKIETKPKFKVGDWITNGDYTWKVVEVKPLDYILQSQDGSTVDDTISYVDGQFHRYCSFCENVEIETTKIPFGAKDSELMEATYFIPKGFHAEIVDNKVIIKKGKQRPADKDYEAKRKAEHDAQLTEEDALNRWLHFKNMCK